MKTQRLFRLKRFVIAFLTSSFILLLHLTPAFNLLERRFLDLAFQIRGYEKPHPDIFIVEIDDESILKMGSWPWSREDHRDLFELIANAHPDVIFYDILFSESSVPGHDQSFANVLKQSANVVLPFYFISDDPSSIRATKAIFPIPVLKESVKAVGFVNVLTDWDGHVRRMIVRAGDFEHVSLVIAKLHQKTREPRYLQTLWINFPGPYPVFQRISFARLIENYEAPEVQSFLKQVRGKIVLIGYTAAGTGMDLKPTVFSPQYPGIGLLASMLHTFLSGKLVHELSPAVHGLLLFVFAFFILFVAGQFPPLRSLFYSLSSLAIIFLVIQLFFQKIYLWVPFSGFLIEGSLLYSISTLLQFVRAQVEREMFDRELELAASIQKNMLPARLSKVPGLEIAAVSVPARQVGGDFYDTIALDAVKMGVCIGDVSGKGVPAALFMAKAISELRKETNLAQPKEVLNALNRKFSQENFRALFLALFYMVIDLAKKEIVYANAGHEPLFFFRSQTQSLSMISNSLGPPLAANADHRYEQSAFQCSKGDLLFLMTDGVRESMNPKKEFFGLQRIKSNLVKFSYLSCDRILGEMQTGISHFVQGAPQHDDFTMLCLKISSS